MGLMKITSVLLTYIQGSFVMMPVNKLLKYDLRGRKKYLTRTNIWICRLGNSEPPENLWQLKHICQMCFKFIYYLWFIAVYKHTDLGTRLNPLSTLRAWSTMATCIFPIGSTGLINYLAYWPIYKQVTVRISLRPQPTWPANIDSTLSLHCECPIHDHCQYHCSTRVVWYCETTWKPERKKKKTKRARL